MNATLDRGETIRRYAPEPALDVPAVRSDPEALHQYARQLERYIELRERSIPREKPDWIDRHPRLSFALAAAGLVGVGAWFFWKAK